MTAAIKRADEAHDEEKQRVRTRSKRALVGAADPNIVPLRKLCLPADVTASGSPVECQLLDHLTRTLRRWLAIPSRPAQSSSPEALPPIASSTSNQH